MQWLRHSSELAAISSPRTRVVMPHSVCENVVGFNTTCSSSRSSSSTDGEGKADTGAPHVMDESNVKGCGNDLSASCTLNREAPPSLSPATTRITGAPVGSSQSLLPRVPAALLSNNGSSRPSEPMAPVGEPAASNTAARGGETAALTFEELLARCTVMLGVPGGVQARKSLRRVLKIWSEGGNMHDCAQDPQQRPQGPSRRRSKQRPALPVEARARTSVGGMPIAGAVADGQSGNGERSLLLAVRGSQVESSVNRDRQLAIAEAAAARWEKRYSQQVSATEKAMLEKRNARISLREIERVLEEERADATRAAHAASVAAAEAAETLRDIADAQDEREGGLKNALSESAEHSLQSMVVRERYERQLRQRLQTSEAKLTAATTEMDEMRKALEAAEKNRSLQPVVVSLGEILKECLASLGLVRGLPEGEFHALVSTLRDRAEKSARGFVSVEGLHAAAEGARALDAMRDVRTQLAETLLDASRQRARRIAADARLKEKEAGEMERAFGKEDLLKARKEVDETRARMAVADAEMKQLKQCLREEQERSAAAWRAATHNRSAPIADVRVIFDEGHRLVEAKLKLKAQQIQQEVSRMQQDLSAEAKLRELGAAGRVSPRPVSPARKELLQSRRHVLSSS